MLLGNILYLLAANWHTAPLLAFKSLQTDNEAALCTTAALPDIRCRIIEQIGVYDPKKGLEGAIIDENLAKKWLAAGAIPSDSIRAMFAKKGLNGKTAKKEVAPKATEAKGAK